MEIVNSTPFETAVVPLDGPDGKPCLVVIVKATFDIQSDYPPIPSTEQIPILFKDEFNESDGTSSVKFESDLAPFKPKTDLVLVGKAHTPPGRAVQILDVSMRVGSLKKTLRIFGDRVWTGTGLLQTVSPSVPKHFTTMDIVYERSYGGIDMEGGAYCAENLVGTGCYAGKVKDIAGKALPNIEDPLHLIKTMQDRPKPVGFGFYNKAWMPRLAFLDQGNPAQYNGAHPDMQMEGFLQGDEEVELEYLSPEGRLVFQLPGTNLSSRLSWPDETQGPPDFSNPDSITWLNKNIDMKLDTLCLIPDDKMFYLVWRGLYPLRADEKPESYKLIVA